jgi:LysM repeat protein
MVGGVVVALLILVLAGIGLVSLLSGDETSPATTLEQLTTTAAPTTTVARTTTTVTPETHIVASGDSLFSIAKQYDVNLSALIAANPQLDDPEDIDIGDVIYLPPAVSPDSGPAGTEPEGADSETSTSATTAP